MSFAGRAAVCAATHFAIADDFVDEEVAAAGFAGASTSSNSSASGTMSCQKMISCVHNNRRNRTDFVGRAVTPTMQMTPRVMAKLRRTDMDED